MGIAVPLVGVPLTAITFYLRALREQMTAKYADVARRIATLEESAATTSRLLSEWERDYATKEEWLRESMVARGEIARLTEAVIRMETAVGLDRARERHEWPVSPRAGRPGDADGGPR